MSPDSHSAEAVGQEDRAWVSVELPMPHEEMLQFCQDVERLFRINPHLTFKQWSATDNTSIRFAGVNSSQDQPFDFDVTLSIAKQPDGVAVYYSDGLKKCTHFKVEADGRGCKLSITDEYREMSAEEKQQRLQEVDRSLIAWAKDIRAYIVQWQRWKKLAFYRWYMRRVWQPLKPMGRRITYMLIWISIFEVTLIALGFAIYWAEHR